MAQRGGFGGPGGAPPGRGGEGGARQKVQKVMTQPINVIFRFFQTKTRVQIWLYDQTDVRIEGRPFSLAALFALAALITLSSPSPLALPSLTARPVFS